MVHLFRFTIFIVYDTNIAQVIFQEEMVTIGNIVRERNKPFTIEKNLVETSVFIDRFTTIISGGDRVSHRMDCLQFRSVGTIKIANCTSVGKLYRTRQI